MLAAQERFYIPSRVTTKHLAEGGRLPSSLSRYTVVTPVPVTLPTRKGGEKEVENAAKIATMMTVPIGVHSLRYTRRSTAFENLGGGRRYDGIFLHHGFGASSLSWLPVLPSLVQSLGKKNGGGSVGVAHDAIGFGFTDRPNGDVEGGLRQYGAENSAGIGLALLLESLSAQRQEDAARADDNDDELSMTATAATAIGKEQVRSIAIFGHSMGARAAMLMALRCATDPTLNLRPDLVLLVAPALEGVTLSAVRRRGGGNNVNISRWNNSKMWRNLAGRVWVKFRKTFIDPVLRYGLRRLVCGNNNSWQNGGSTSTYG